jgi:hypothetical protein
MSKGLGYAILRVGALNLVATFGHAAVIYNFSSFDEPGSGSAAGAGTNRNGIANNGAAVGFAIGNGGAFTNSVRNPNGAFTTLTLNNTAIAFGINNAGDVVGTQNNAAIFLPPGGPLQTIPTPGTPSTAFGINDLGNVVGQFTSATATPGFFIQQQPGRRFHRYQRAVGDKHRKCTGSQ